MDNKEERDGQVLFHPQELTPSEATTYPGDRLGRSCEGLSTFYQPKPVISRLSTNPVSESVATEQAVSPRTHFDLHWNVRSDCKIHGKEFGTHENIGPPGPKLGSYPVFLQRVSKTYVSS